LDRTGTLRVTFNEDIAPASATTTTIAIASGTRPIGGTPTIATGKVTTVSVGDVDRDVSTGTNGNVVSVGVDNVFALNTGDTVNVSVADEAGNKFTQNLILVDTIRPFAVSVVVADNACSADTVVITASEALLPSSVTDARTLYTVAGVTISGAQTAVLSAGAAASAQVAVTALNVITLSFPDGTLLGLTSGSTFTTVPVAGAVGFGGVTDLAENRTLFLNDGTVLIAGPPPVTSACVVNDTVPPRLIVTAADFVASTWKVGAGAPPAVQPVAMTVVVRFSEPVDPTTSLNASNYTFTSADADIYSAVTSVVASTFGPGGSITSVLVTVNLTSVAGGNGATGGDKLTVSKVMDISGNAIAVSNVLTLLPIPALPAVPPTTYGVTCP
jgi:hypothetical protein